MSPSPDRAIEELDVYRGTTMGKHENRVVGTALLVQITLAALLLLAGYLAN